MDDAFQLFVDKVLALRLADGRTPVAAVLALPGTTPDGRTASAAHEHELRRVLLAQRQVGAPRPLPGGVEVDVWLPSSRLTQILQELARRIPHLNRSRVVLHAGAGPTVTATGRYVPDGLPRDERPGWRHCTDQQIRDTADAAALDLRQNLLGVITDLRFRDGKTMRSILAEQPRLRESIERRLKSLRPTEPVYEPTGVCRVALPISRKGLAAMLSEAARDAGENGPPHIGQAAESLPVERPVEGFALPPPPYAPAMRAREPAADPDRPAWANRFLTQQARGVPPPGAGEARARRELAAKAARLEAARLIWLEIEKLPLASETVGDRLARDPSVHSAAAAIDALIIPVSSPVYAADDSATVTLGLRLEAVWGVLRDLH